MKRIGELFQTEDWKKEKHVPEIDAPDTVKEGQPFTINVAIGKEISHPNTTDHHIRWVQVYYKPEGEKFAYQVANCEFSAHGESVDGADKGPVYTDHTMSVRVSVKKPGTLYAASLCNIHGLWESEKYLSLA